MRKHFSRALIGLLLLSLFAPIFGQVIQAESSESKFPLTITDTSEREVSFEEKPETVVSLGPNMTEILIALGLGDRLVGRTAYCDYPEEVQEIQEIGTLQEPNFEIIAEVNPDLVVASTHVSDETLEKLEELEIPVLMLYSDEKLDGLKDIITTLGQVFDVQDAAEALNKRVFDTIDYVRNKESDLEKPTVYYVVGFGEYGEFTAGGNTFVHDIIEAAGGENVAADVEGWSYSLEQLVEADPDIIILPEWAKDSFGSEEPYSELTAVKENRVFAIDNNLIDRQGPRNAEGVFEMYLNISQIAIDMYAKDSEYPLTITDTAEREVEIVEAPKKIISLGPNMTELMFALGAGELLVGRTTYCDYPEAAAEIEDVGTLQEPNFEVIAELAPDLVLASTHVPEEALAKLEELEIPVIVLYDEAELDGVEGIINTLGEALNLNKEAKKLSVDLMGRINRTRIAQAGLDEVRVYFVVGFGEYGEFTAGGDTFINDIIEAAGAKNVAADVEGWSYSLEKLVEEDPDVILIPAWAEESFGSEEPYSELTAVKEDKVFVIDENIFVRQGARNAEAVEVLAKMLNGLFETTTDEFESEDLDKLEEEAGVADESETDVENADAEDTGEDEAEETQKAA